GFGEEKTDGNGVKLCPFLRLRRADDGKHHSAHEEKDCPKHGDAYVSLKSLRSEPLGALISAMRQPPRSLTRSIVTVFGSRTLVKFTVATALSEPLVFTSTLRFAISQSWASRNGSPSSVPTSLRFAAVAKSLIIASASFGSNVRRI